MATITLKQLLIEHPEWGDHELVIIDSNGDYDYVGAAGMVYADNSATPPVLVFAGN